MTDPKDPAKSPRDPKKSESLEVRVPWRLKQEFMARARREGRSASEVIRDLMQDYVRRPAQRPLPQTLETAMTAIRKRPAPAFAAVLGAAGVSALLASTIPAGAAPDLRAEFAAMDANGDGAVTMEELEGAIHVDPVIVRRDPGVDNERVPRFARVVLLPLTDTPGERRIMVEEVGDIGGGQQQPMDWNQHILRVLAEGDANGDGKLSPDEYVARHAWLVEHAFAMMDANKDGALETAELIAVGPQDGAAAEQARATLDAMDADGDGRITDAEYQAAL